MKVNISCNYYSFYFLIENNIRIPKNKATVFSCYTSIKQTSPNLFIKKPVDKIFLQNPKVVKSYNIFFCIRSEKWYCKLLFNLHFHYFSRDNFCKLVGNYLKKRVNDFLHFQKLLYILYEARLSGRTTCEKFY